MAIVFALCAVALAYLYMHNSSLRIARRVAALEKEQRSRTEALGAIRVRVSDLAGFARLESVWVACGRPNRGAESFWQPPGEKLQVAAVGEDRREGTAHEH